MKNQYQYRITAKNKKGETVPMKAIATETETIRMKNIDEDTYRIIKELLRFRKRYRRKYVLQIILNFIEGHL